MLTQTTSGYTSPSGIYYESLGCGEPVLAIHGIISDHSFFEEAAALMSDNHLWVTYDRRGYDKSHSSGNEDYSISAQTEDASEVLRSVTDHPAWILGHSAGGLIALLLAVRYPELVRGLILLETPICCDKHLSQEIDQWFRQLEDIRDSGKIKKALPLFSRQIGGSAPGRGFDLAKIQRTYRNLGTFLNGELDSLHKDTIAIEQLRQISVPCRILVTEHGQSSIFGQSVQDTAARMHWPITLIPGYHNVIQEDPAAFASAFLPILQDMMPYCSYE